MTVAPMDHFKMVLRMDFLRKLEAKLTPMIDTGATHKFFLKEELKRLKLQTSKEVGWLKVVNFAAKPSNGIADGVIMKIRHWEGKVDLTMTPMDDFKMVLRIGFLRRFKVVPLQFLRLIAILKEMTPCIVPTVTEGKIKSPMLSQQCN